MSEVVAENDVSSPRRRARRALPRARTINTRRLSHKEHQRLNALYEADEVRHPVTRAECLSGGENEQRPCPFVGCKYHLFLDVEELRGSIKLNFPDREVWEMTESCSLDVADRGGATLEAIGGLMNLTKERVRQYELAAIEKRRAELEAIAEGNDIRPDPRGHYDFHTTSEASPVARLPMVDREALLAQARAAGAARGPADGALAFEPIVVKARRSRFELPAATVQVADPASEHANARKTPEPKTHRKCARTECENMVPVIANQRFCSDLCQNTAERERRNHRYALRHGSVPLDRTRRDCKHCNNPFVPRFPNERYCVNCKAFVPTERRSKRERQEIRMQQAQQQPARLTIICEHGYGSMAPRVCGMRWGIAHNRPIQHKNSPIEVASIKKSKCLRCTHGEARIDPSDLRAEEPAAPPAAPVKRVLSCFNCHEEFEAALAEGDRIPMQCSTCTSAPAEVRQARADAADARERPAAILEPEESSLLLTSPRCECGAAVVRRPGQAGRLPKKCDVCRAAAGVPEAVTPPAPAARPSAKAPTSPGVASDLAGRLQPILDDLISETHALEALVVKRKQEANTLAAVAGVPAPYPGVA